VVCGSPIYGNGVQVFIDVAEFVVYPRCAGKSRTVKTPQTDLLIQPLKKGPKIPRITTTGTRPQTKSQAHLHSQPRPRWKSPATSRVSDNFKLVDNYGQAIRIRLLQPASKTPPAEDRFSYPLDLILGDVSVMMKRHGQR
jgi:ribosome-binding protein aMBF1 (putative translation factor)